MAVAFSLVSFFTLPLFSKSSENNNLSVQQKSIATPAQKPQLGSELGLDFLFPWWGEGTVWGGGREGREGKRCSDAI